MELLYEAPDLSYHNGTVNMTKIKDAGCKRVFLRAGYGKNNADKKFATNAAAAQKLGMTACVYWFSYAYTAAMAKNEADYAVAKVKKYWGSCPIAFDWEYDSKAYAQKKGITVSKSLATEMAIAFLAEVKAAGYIPVLYTNEDYLKNYFDLDAIKAAVGTVYLWYARYTSKLTSARQGIVDIWQYTSSGSISGVTGSVDMNKVYTDFGESADEEQDDDEYYPLYTGISASIVTALRTVGETDTSMAHRKLIAAANGITGYKGTAPQNTAMVKMLRTGTLKKA